MSTLEDGLRLIGTLSEDEYPEKARELWERTASLPIGHRVNLVATICQLLDELAPEDEETKPDRRIGIYKSANEMADDLLANFGVSANPVTE